MEGMLVSLVNLVTQLAANQKPASVAKVCGIRSSNDYHTETTTTARGKALVREDGSQLLEVQVQEIMPLSLEEFMMWLRDISRSKLDSLEGKLDALANLVTQLAANRSVPLLQESTTSVLPTATILVSVLLRNNWSG
ncbi:hypothetical protein Fmac_015281 [Flemingia macrophylla]|uniref:Uncharacterized protein n=1 Tax=Flemingia macrophylla TaxID=520843 RepID=A0ABD1MF17_9FABA